MVWSSHDDVPNKIHYKIVNVSLEIDYCKQQAAVDNTKKQQHEISYVHAIQQDAV